MRAADRLLRELPNSPRREVLACYTLMAYKMRNQIDKAAAMLLELLATEKDYVPALVCLSQARPATLASRRPRAPPPSRPAALC